MQEIPKIPVKKKMTGAQIGRAVLSSYVYDYIHGKDEIYTPMYTPDDLRRMISALPGQYEQRVYTEYINLYNGVVTEFTRAQGAFQQAQFGLFSLTAALEQVSLKYEALRFHDWITDVTKPNLSASFPGMEQSFRLAFGMIEDLLCDPALAQRAREARDELFYPAIAGVRAYNNLIGVISSVFDMPFILHIQLDEKYLMDRLDACNHTRDMVLLGFAGERTFSVPFEKMFPTLDQMAGYPSALAVEHVKNRLHEPQSYEGGSLLPLLRILIEKSEQI